jgi:hypothetical protein
MNVEETGENIKYFETGREKFKSKKNIYELTSPPVLQDFIYKYITQVY